MKQTILAYLLYFILLPAAYAVVDINNASQAELETLNGIGPAKAQAIIEYRKKSGGFKSVDELDQVPGIGQATLANLKKDVAISGKKAASTETIKGDKKK
jgi:competence protein ComEA